MGALLSMSSTAVVVKCLEVMRSSSSAYGQITTGTLLLQVGRCAGPYRAEEARGGGEEARRRGAMPVEAEGFGTNLVPYRQLTPL